MNSLASTMDALYQTESRRVLATLIRLLGDIDLAEEALQEAFSIALRQWPEQGIPANPRAWLVSTGRFKAIDQLRRRARFDASLDDVAQHLEDEAAAAAFDDDPQVEDDQLRLIFLCCHPALSEAAQIALTLREVCGLTTEEIASAFLTGTSTLAQRIVRAKAKIKRANIPFELPPLEQLNSRLEAVLQVIYLVFNEGYSASSGNSVIRHSLSDEAIRLARLLLQLLPSSEMNAEIQGLLALMLLHQSRDAARMNSAGELVLLEQQDRRLWNKDKISEGCFLVQQALRSGRAGPYALQAAIAAVHAEAERFVQTDWREVVGLYDVLLRVHPSPVVALNRAVAVSMRDGAEAGLALIDALIQQGDLQQYYLAHAAKADLCRRLGQIELARQAYQQALNLTQQGPEQRFLQRRLAELDG
ncbi:MAG TPA: RNA polymerase sigma factor [Pseudomonadales bacterium]|nr:RNA polymerase sigma factor [Pseudomonadales bacterium]